VYSLTGADGQRVTDSWEWLQYARQRTDPAMHPEFNDPEFRVMVEAMALCADDNGNFDEDTLTDAMAFLGCEVTDRPAPAYLVGA
jgi:hypothetical protein